jgi:hypothetical protein
LRAAAIVPLQLVWRLKLDFLPLRTGIGRQPFQ